MGSGETFAGGVAGENVDLGEATDGFDIFCCSASREAFKICWQNQMGSVWMRVVKDSLSSSRRVAMTLFNEVTTVGLSAGHGISA